MAYSSLWSDGRADDHIAQQLSPLSSYCTLESAQLRTGLNNSQKPGFCIQ